MCPSQSLPCRRALTYAGLRHVGASLRSQIRRGENSHPRLGETRLHALTLVEMLVSLVCVLLLMLAYTQLFSSVGTRITEARSMIDLTNRMRSAATRLRTDLAGHTCDLIPPQNPASGDGYFEYIEGPLHDKPGENGLPFDATSGADSKFLGDTDDVLMFTARCKDGAFSGHYNGKQVQSQIAEVVWFLRPTMLVDPSSGAGIATVQASPPTFTLYRRTFLVLPTYQGNPTVITARQLSPQLWLPNANFYQNNDISVHYEINGSAGNFVPNSLGDLAKRECRFGHAFINNASLANGFPASRRSCIYLSIRRQTAESTELIAVDTSDALAMARMSSSPMSLPSTSKPGIQQRPFTRVPRPRRSPSRPPIRALRKQPVQFQAVLRHLFMLTLHVMRWVLLSI